MHVLCVIIFSHVLVIDSFNGTLTLSISSAVSIILYIMLLAKATTCIICIPHTQPIQLMSHILNCFTFVGTDALGHMRNGLNDLNVPDDVRGDEWESSYQEQNLEDTASRYISLCSVLLQGHYSES